MNILAAIFRNTICKFLFPIPIRRIYNFISVKSKVIDDLLVECSNTWIKQSKRVTEISLAMCRLIYFNKIRFELFPFYKYFTKKYEMWGFYFQQFIWGLSSITYKENSQISILYGVSFNFAYLAFFFQWNERKWWNPSFCKAQINSLFITSQLKNILKAFIPPWKKQPTG